MAKRAKPAKTETVFTKPGEVVLGVRIPIELHKRLKKEAIDKEMTLQAWVTRKLAREDRAVIGPLPLAPHEDEDDDE